MRITISGTPGSGKSTVAGMIAEKLKLKRYSVGDFRGQMAMERGMTIDELNKVGESEFFTDKLADEWQKQLGRTEDNFVIDGRLSFHFIPDSVKVFLECDLDVGAQRIFADQREDEEEYRSIGEAGEALKKRMESDRKRYMKYYEIDPFRHNHYDILIDTTSLRPDEVAEKILHIIRKQTGQ